MSSNATMMSGSRSFKPHHEQDSNETAGDHPSPGNHGNSDITSSHEKTNTNHRLITTSSCDANYITPLLSPTIPYQSSPKLIWQSPPPIPLAFAPPIPSPKYPFNCNNPISIVQTAAVAAAAANGIHGAASTLPVFGSLQQMPQVASSSAFQLTSQSPREVTGHPEAATSTVYGGAKRKRDESFISTSEPSDIEDHVSVSKAEHSVGAGEGTDFIDASGAITSAGGGGASGAASQSVSWRAHQVDSWYEMCDATLQDIPSVSFRVEANKGFTYSPLDEAFVCQKKNHFQVTITCQVTGTPRFIKMKDGGLQPIKKFTLCLHGIKLESEMSVITLDQSLVDRSKKKLEDIEVEFEGDEAVCKTIGRLHFSETTLNNMRKKGKPNPDQKYFSLVVALIAHTANGNCYTIVAHVSERIIVRASNPGTFDNDSDIIWNRAATSANSIYYMGCVGINTDKPAVALSVHGNARITGNILQPSDCRVKDDIVQVDSSEQLDNVTKLRICHFSYTPEYAATVGMATPHNHCRDVGLIAQELQEVMPDAVQCNGDLELHNGECLEQFLCVKKDRIMMESIGAIQELNKINHQLSARIEALENMQQGLICHSRSWKCQRFMKCPFSIKTTTIWRILLLLIVLLSVIMLTILHHHGNRTKDSWETSLSTTYHHHHNELLHHSAASL